MPTQESAFAAGIAALELLALQTKTQDVMCARDVV